MRGQSTLLKKRYVTCFGKESCAIYTAFRKWCPGAINLFPIIVLTSTRFLSISMEEYTSGDIHVVP